MRLKNCSSADRRHEHLGSKENLDDDELTANEYRRQQGVVRWWMWWMWWIIPHMRAGG